MTVYLIRHAPAEPRSSELRDDARPLTARGRKRWRRAVRGLGRLGVRFERVIHSPLLRAVETAEELLQLCDGESAVSTRLADRPGPDLLTELHGKSVALVGHEPWLSELVALLVLGDASEAPRFLLRKGSVCELEGMPVPGGMQLISLLPMAALEH